MTKTSISPSLLALALFLCTSIAFAQTDDRADARGLIDNARNGMALAVAAAQKDKSLNLKVAKSKPFWNGLQDLNRNLETAAAGLDGRDDRFFTGIASANANFVQAEIALLMMGSENEGVANAMQAIGGSWTS